MLTTQRKVIKREVVKKSPPTELLVRNHPTVEPISAVKHTNVVQLNPTRHRHARCDAPPAPRDAAESIYRLRLH
jgi:hypothetical protein